MNTDTETRIFRRRNARLLAGVAMAAALALGASGCSVDAMDQAQKSLGDDGTAVDSDMPSLADKYTPMDELVLTDGVDDLEAGLNAAQKLAFAASASSRETSSNRRIHLTILSPQVDLVRAGETYHGKQRTCVGLERIPNSVAKIPAGGTGESCFDSAALTDISQELTYRLPGTNQLFWIYVKVPVVGDPVLQCNIFDPATWKPVEPKRTAYTCDLQWMQMGYNVNPMPRVRVTKKDTIVVTDPAQAKKLLEENCGKMRPECDYSSTRQRVVSPPAAEWTLLDTYTNCGPDQHEGAEHSWAQEKEFSGTYTVSAEGSFGYGNPAHDKVVAKLKAEYKHIWSVTNVYLAEVEQPVPYGTTNLFYAQLSYLELTGDFTIITKDHVYILKDSLYKLPLSEEWKDEDGNVIKPMEKHSLGASADCSAISGGNDKDHGPKLKRSVQKQLDAGIIPSADVLLAAGATLTSGE